MARHQHHTADAGGGRGAARLGHAFDRKPRGFDRFRGFFERIDGGKLAVEQIKVGERAHEQIAFGETGEGIFGRRARHRHRACGEVVGARAGDVVGRDDSLPAANEGAQAHAVAFRAFGFLDGTVAHLHGEGY